MIDIGPNLASEQFNNDLEEVIKKAVSNKVEGLILTSTDYKSYKKNLEIINTFKNDIYIKTTFGLHPHYAAKDETVFSQIHNALINPDVVAIGEFGLDYFRMLAPKEKQQEVMNKFLQHAKNFPHLSLFLHERDAFNDFYHILKECDFNNKAVVHCFTGNKENAKQYLDLGCYIGITGWISDQRRNASVKDAVRYIPLSKLMIETDCPYLTPHNLSNRIKRNEPAFLYYVAKSIAEIKNISIEQVIEKTTENTLDFFNLSDYNNNYINRKKYK